MPFDCIQGLQQLSKVRISYGRHEGGTLFSLASRPFQIHRVVSKIRITIEIRFYYQKACYGQHYSKISTLSFVSCFRVSVNGNISIFRCFKSTYTPGIYVNNPTPYTHSMSKKWNGWGCR